MTERDLCAITPERNVSERERDENADWTAAIFGLKVAHPLSSVYTLSLAHFLHIHLDSIVFEATDPCAIFLPGPLNAIFVISEADETGKKDGGEISRAGATQWLKRDSDEQRKQHMREREGKDHPFPRVLTVGKTYQKHHPIFHS